MRNLEQIETDIANAHLNLHGLNEDDPDFETFNALEEDYTEEANKVRWQLGLLPIEDYPARLCDKCTPNSEFFTQEENQLLGRTI